MNFLEALADISLQKLYKFIINRTIGQYLADDLLLEQVQVSSRDGHVCIHDLSLDCDVLNAQLSAIPFKLTKAVVKKLEAKLSYKMLLAESCRFDFYGLELVLEPDTAIIVVDNKSAVNKSSETKKSGGVSTENEKHDDESIEYIASWINILLSSLQIYTHDITISLRIGAYMFNFHVGELKYLNSYNSNVVNETSISAVSKSMLNKSDSYPATKASKVSYALLFCYLDSRR